MADQTITLSYDERSALLTIMAMARPEVNARHPEYLDMLDAIALRVSRLECQPGGCPHCNADAAREEYELLMDEVQDHIKRNPDAFDPV